jgi:hypothetical protein
MAKQASEPQKRRRRTVRADPPPWKRKNPHGNEPTPLTPEQKAAARQRAKEAGRRYPNLVDNMWAAQGGSK